MPSKRIKFVPSCRRPLNSHRRQPKGDFFFGDGELEPMTMEYTTGYVQNVMNNDNDWTLPKEAFPLRHEIQDRSPPPEQFPNHSPEINDDAGSVTVEDQPCQLVVSSVPKPRFWDFTHLVEDALRHHAAIRDIQTSASVLIALGEKRNNLNIEKEVQEHWLLEYIDMLGRFKLYDVVTQVLKTKIQTRATQIIFRNNIAIFRTFFFSFSNLAFYFLDYSIGLDSFDIANESAINDHTCMLYSLYETSATLRMAMRPLSYIETCSLFDMSSGTKKNITTDKNSEFLLLLFPNNLQANEF